MSRYFMESQWPGAIEETKVEGNYVCCLVIVVILLWPKRQRFFKVSIRREGEKPQTRGAFMGRRKKTTQVVDHWTTLSGINYYFSLFCCKKIYALHKIRSYKNLIGKVWINFSSWIYFYLHYWFFFIDLQMTTEWAFVFLNPAVIIFCLRYSLNIPHSNEVPSFFPV